MHRLFVNLTEKLVVQSRISTSMSSFSRETETECSGNKEVCDGVTLFKEGNYKQAIEMFILAIQVTKDPANKSIAFCNLGNAYAMLGEKFHAIDALRMAIELNPDDAHSHHDLAQMYVSADLGKLANKHFEIVDNLEKRAHEQDKDSDEDENKEENSRTEPSKKLSAGF